MLKVQKSHQLPLILTTIVLLIGVVTIILQRNFSVSNQVSSLHQPQDIVTSKPNSETSERAAPNFSPPLGQSRLRVTKKPFGLHVTPKDSPVHPERFQGFHTGVDFEAFENETTLDVPVNAVCPGKVIFKQFVSGYGGVIIQSCLVDGESITVLYGHLSIETIEKGVGDEVFSGDQLGLLGKGESSETDGERKHLHLSFHRGTEIDLRGYVSSGSELVNWLDPCQYACHD